jgi:hypothetical protein
MKKKKASSARKKSVAFEDPSTSQVAPAQTEQGTSPPLVNNVFLHLLTGL